MSTVKSYAATLRNMRKKRYYYRRHQRWAPKFDRDVKLGILLVLGVVLLLATISAHTGGPGLG